MKLLLELGTELAALVAVSGATLLAALVLRDPLGPKWLRTEGAAQGASLVLVALLLIAVASAVEAFVTAGFHYAVAALATIGLLIAPIYPLWKLFHIGERLKLADAGRTPFEALARGPAISKLELPAH